MGIPPFCPNPRCKHHMQPQSKGWFRPHGFHLTKTFGHVPRFQCTDCGKTFSTQTFVLDYWAKKVIDYRDLANRHGGSMSLRGTSRALKASCGTVQNRLDRLCRQALALHARLRPLADPTEAVCIDGFVSFDVSQFFPNEITISMTHDSLFMLDLSHATRRRSGSMTTKQAKKAKQLYGEIPLERGGIKRTFRDILDSLELERVPSPHQPLIIITDEKPDYEWVLHRHPLFTSQNEERRVVHVGINSKLPRTFRNPLFPSNYIDRQIRKDQANHHRETACFSRNVANGMSRLGLYLILHNYMKKFRIKARVADTRVHAEAAGIPKDLVREAVSAMFWKRAFLTRIEIPPTLSRIWTKDFPTPGTSSPARLPRYAIG